jgi:hypothetical protein
MASRRKQKTGIKIMPCLFQPQKSRHRVAARIPEYSLSAYPRDGYGGIGMRRSAANCSAS